MKRLKKVLIGILIVVVILFTSGFIVLNQNTYPAIYDDQTFLTESQLDGRLRIFEPKTDIKANIIFYPGGLVKRDAYAYFAYLLAEEGFRVFLVGMPLNLAILDIHAAKRIPTDYPSDLNWYVGGHSLGGAAASLFAAKHQDLIEGIFFLGSYPANGADLSNVDIKSLSIIASQDLIINLDNFQDTKKLLPDHTLYETIEGGNHSYFGYYGEQKGDGIATITREKQHELAIISIISWINA